MSVEGTVICCRVVFLMRDNLVLEKLFLEAPS